MTTNRPLYSDTELFLLIQSKERKQFEIIYDTYSPIIYGFMIHSGLSEKYSEDILQQTFIAMWNHSVPMPSNHKMSFLNWIFYLTTDSIKTYLQTNNRTFIINYKSYASISVEFTDVSDSPSVHVCIA